LVKISGMFKVRETMNCNCEIGKSENESGATRGEIFPSLVVVLMGFCEG